MKDTNRVWVDEFEGPAGTAPSSRWWVAELGSGDEGQMQTYTTPPANVALDGHGHLVIQARREADGTIGSARLRTKDRVTVRYGTVEARIRVPSGQGVWPAFWMLGTNIDEVGWPACGEIDVMEYVGSQPCTVHGTLHGPGYAGVENGHGTAYETGVPLADDFHVYGVDWTADRVTWLLDGIAYATATPADVPAGSWPFEHDFYLLLNLAIGGTWPGNDVDHPRLPATMLIDWVRVHAPASG